MVELAAAAAIIASVALAAGGAPARTTRPSSGSSVAGEWSARAVPVVTALVDDLSAIDGAANPSDARHTALGAAKALMRDVARARSLGPPADGLAARWSDALSQVDVVTRTLTFDSSGGRDGPLQAQAEAATEALVSFVAVMERSRG